MATHDEKPAGPDLTQGVAEGDLADGHMLAGHVGDDPVLVARVGDEILAIGGTCTHYGGPLGEGVLDGDTVRCPWHHACFSLRTGVPLRAPAFDRVARWRVEVSDGRIFVREKLARSHEPAKPTGTGSPGGRFVIVGGGAAGFAAAERLRREGFDGDLTIVSADPDLPVDRPNLSKDYLAGKAPEDWVYVKPADFYAKHGIRLDLRTEVAAIDPAGREVRLADGRSLGFDKLLLATGAEPIRLAIPGAGKPHVFTLRSLADSRAIIAKAADSKTAAVFGASFIGLEAAASLTERGLGVQVIAPEARPLEKVLGPALGDLIQKEHENHGVVFHLGRKPAAIEDRHVVLDDGTRIDAELVVMGVGVRPRTALAERAGLKADDGVVVDAFMETSAPGVFAAGDIARFPYALPGGGTARIEHWVVAERQGQIAALNMLGRGLRFAQAPFFWSMHYDMPVRYVGHAEAWDRTEEDGSVAAHDGLVRYENRGGMVVAVATIFRDRDNLEAELALERAARSSGAGPTPSRPAPR